MFNYQERVFKKIFFTAFSKPRKVGVIAVGMDKDDQLVSACVCSPGEDIFILTKKGFCIRFPEESVRSVGRTARGVRGISLRKGDAVISMDNVSRDSPSSYMTMTEEGYGKRTRLEECRSQKRGGMGITAHRVTDKTGEVVCAHLVEGFHQVLVMTNQGQSIRFSCKEISIIGRSAQGVRLIKLKAGEKVSSASLLNENSSSD